MDFILSSVFGQALQRTSLVGAVLVVILVGLVILAFTFIRAKIDQMRQEAEHKTQLRDREYASKESLREREYADKEASQKALHDELKESRQQMLNHMALDRREKDRLTRTLGQMIAEIRASVKVLDSLNTKVDAVKDEVIRGRGRVN